MRPRAVLRMAEIRRLAPLLLLVVSLFLPLIAGDMYQMRVLVLVLVFYIEALGYSVIVTSAGMLDLGFAGYWTVGAYIGAMLTLKLGVSFWLALPISVLGTVLVILALTVPLLRFRGDYLCIVTLAAGEIIRNVLNNWTPVTGGPYGLLRIPAPRVFSYEFSSPVPFFYLLLVLSLSVYWLCTRLASSGVGLAWSALRQNEEAAVALGINANRYRRIAYCVGAGLAAVSGCCYAHLQGFIDPTTASLPYMLSILTMAILGGGTAFGVLVSAIVLTVLPELLRSLDLYQMLALGVALVFVMNARPEGFGANIMRHFRLSRGQPGKGTKGEDEARYASAGTPASSSRVANGDSTVATGLLEGKGVVKDFGGLRALNGVDFTLRQGEILGIIGPNGAGKTTLFNVITRVYPATSGEIRYLGENVARLRPYEIARVGISRTFQNLKLLGSCTLLDNVMLSRLHHLRMGLTQVLGGQGQRAAAYSGDVSAARKALEFVGLGEQVYELARNLPYGSQRMLELARALASQPRILFLDEPCAGLNPTEAENLMTLLRKVNQQGTTIILIEHNMRVAMGLSQRLIVLDHGMVIAEGIPSEIRENPEVIEAYLGRRRGA